MNTPIPRLGCPFSRPRRDKPLPGLRPGYLAGLVIFVFLALTQGAGAESPVWSPSTNDWSDPNNWNTETTPTSTSSPVVVDEDGPFSALVSGAPQAAGDLIVGQNAFGVVSIGGTVPPVVPGAGGGVLTVSGTLTLGLNEGTVGTVYVVSPVGQNSDLTVGGELIVGSLGTGVLNITGPNAAVNAGGNISVGDQVVHTTDGTHDFYSDQTGPNTGTINITTGAALHAGTSFLTISAAGTGTVNVGAGGTDTATLKVNGLAVGAFGTGTLNIAGSGAVVTVNSGNVDLGMYWTDPLGSDGELRLGHGTVTITEGGTLDAGAAGGYFFVGALNNHSAFGLPEDNQVNVGTSANDIATLKTASLEIGVMASSGVMTINGSGAVVTVNTGNLTVGSGISGVGDIIVINGGVLDATSVAGNGVTSLGDDPDSYGQLSVGLDFNNHAAGAGTFKADSLSLGSGFNAAGIMNVYGGSTVTITHDVTVGGGGAGSLTIDSSTFTVKDGNLNVIGTSAINSQVGLSQSTVHLEHGDVNVGAQGRIVAAGSSLLVLDDGSVNVNAGGVFKAGGNSTVSINDGLGDFHNAGTLAIDSSTSVPAPGVTPFTIDGNLIDSGGTLRFSTMIDSQLTLGTKLLEVTGQFSLTADTKLVLDLYSPAQPEDFDPTQAFQFLLVQADGGITGFDPDMFALDTSHFLNDLQGGTFSISLAENNLMLDFNPAAVPEPSTWALLVLGLGGLFWKIRKKIRHGTN